MKLSEWNQASGFTSAASRRSLPNGQVAVSYLNWCQARNLSPQTLRSYHSTLSAWVDYLGARQLSDVELSELEDFLQRPRQRRGKGRMGSPATRKREASCMRSFYEWMLSSGYVEHNPALHLQGPKVNEHNPKPIPIHHWLRIWSGTLTDGERLFLGLGYFLGLRREEIIRLQCHQITPTIIRSFVRKGAKEHTIPWAEMISVYETHLPEYGSSEPFVQALNHFRMGEGQLLPWASDDPNSLNKRLYQIHRRSGAPEPEWWTPHQLRHSCVTNLLTAGVPLHLVASLMNHTNPAVTMRYAQAGGHQLRDWRLKDLTNRPSQIC